MICPRCDGGGHICDRCQEPAEYLMTDDKQDVCQRCINEKENV